MNWKTISIALLALMAIVRLAAADAEQVNLIVDKDGELELPYGEQKTVEFVCPWDGAKVPTVLDLQARIDTPRHPPLSGGPIPILTIELNGEPLEGDRLINKPLKSARENPSECVWFVRPKWCLMYAGAWDPPPNSYTPQDGSPVRFILEVGDLLNPKGKNKLAFIYCETLVGSGSGDQAERVPLSTHCRRNNLGDATILFGGMVVRPRKDSDVFK